MKYLLVLFVVSFKKRNSLRRRDTHPPPSLLEVYVHPSSKHDCLPLLASSFPSLRLLPSCYSKSEKEKEMNLFPAFNSREPSELHRTSLSTISLSLSRAFSFAQSRRLLWFLLSLSLSCIASCCLFSLQESRDRNNLSSGEKEERKQKRKSPAERASDEERKA